MPATIKTPSTRRAASALAGPDGLSAFPSALGWMAVATRRGAIVSLSFGHRGAKAAIASLAAGLPGENDLRPASGALIHRLQAYARGQVEDLGDLPIELPPCTPFRRRVLLACRRIGYGQTISYGQLAASVGAPGAARAVGTCMATNPLPLIVPCHRVIPAAGPPGFYSAPGGARTKLRLLAMERAGQFVNCVGRKFECIINKPESSFHGSVRKK